MPTDERYRAAIPGTMYGTYRELSAPSAPRQLRPAEATTANTRVNAASSQVTSASCPPASWRCTSCTDRVTNSQHTAAPTTTPNRIHTLGLRVAPKARAKSRKKYPSCCRSELSAPVPIQFVVKSHGDR